MACLGNPDPGDMKVYCHTGKETFDDDETAVYAIGTGALDATTTVYTGTTGGVSISTNGGTTFTNYTTGLGNNFVRGVCAIGSTVYAATVAKRVSVAKQVFKAAIRWGWLTKNPFADLRSGSQSNPARARYVSLEAIRDILDACPSVDWRVLVALARLAGLRCPSEIGALTWGDINWEKGRLTVLAKKTEHHGGEHAVRVVPICPELRTILADAFEQAEAGRR